MLKAGEKTYMGVKDLNPDKINMHRVLNGRHVFFYQKNGIEYGEYLYFIDSETCTKNESYSWKIEDIARLPISEQSPKKMPKEIYLVSDDKLYEMEINYSNSAQCDNTINTIYSSKVSVIGYLRKKNSFSSAPEKWKCFKKIFFEKFNYEKTIELLKKSSLVSVLFSKESGLVDSITGHINCEVRVERLNA